MDMSGLRPAYSDSDRLTAEVEKRLRTAGKMTGNAAADEELKQLDAVTRDMESLFVNMLLKEMRKTVNEQQLIYGGPGEKIFREMLDEETSKSVANTPGAGGFGIAKTLYDQLSRPILERVKQQQKESSLDGQ